MLLLFICPAMLAQQSSPSEEIRVPSLATIVADKTTIMGDSEAVVLELSIEECIKSALAHNYDIQIESYNPALRIDDITAAESVFDVTMFGSAQYDNLDENNIDATYTQKYVDVNGKVTSERVIVDGYNRYHNNSFSLGLGKKLSTGGSLQISENARRINDLFSSKADLYYEPFVEYSTEIQLQQPLLRNFGVDVNRAAIRAARSRLNISKEEFNLKVINTMLEVERNYWLLYYYRQHVKIRQQLLERAQETLDRVIARNDYDGKSSSIARTRAVIEEARADMLSAKNSALRQQETLLVTINDPKWPISVKCEIITLDDPQQRPYDISFEQAVETALELRPELIAQKNGIDIARLALGMAQNQTLPRADLFVTHKIMGADIHDESAFRDQGNYDTYNWSIGMSIEYPLANRAAKAALSQASKQKEQEELRLKFIQEQILYDVSVSLHDLHHKYSEIKARMDSVDAARNELLNYLAIQDTERKDSTNPEFLNLKLNADDRLSRNQITAVQAMIEYDMAIMNIHRAQGCLDKYNNIEIKIEN
ncbi:MAG: TolC family protein [Sedimentisphaerales bacterium]|nr:TolC family protein [Sedimentisphaerales bacterium]